MRQQRLVLRVSRNLCLQDVAEVVEHDANVLGVGFNVVKPLERVSGLGPGRQGIGRS